MTSGCHGAGRSCPNRLPQLPSWLTTQPLMRSLAALALASLLGCVSSPPRDPQFEPPRDPQVERLLAAFCSDPVGNADAARWFASLPLPTQRAYAGRIGVVLLIATIAPADASARDTEEFAWGCGASRSPYPWVFVISKGRLDLSGDNSFHLVLRDDAFVRAVTGPYWVSTQSYDRLESATGPLFAKRPSGKGQAGNDLWIPATSWRYVGPKLEIQPGMLKATEVNRY